MISLKHLVLIFISYALIGFKMITGFPVENSSTPNTYANDQFEVKNETRYPNGTVIGEFSYFDDNGNPINVKYYADEFNYGVELRSAKVIGPGKGTFWTASNFETIKKTDKVQEKTKKINVAQEDTKNKLDVKNVKKLADYETFYRKDINGLNQCNKDKVRVYLDRERKIIKRALENYQAKSCGRY